MFRNKKKKIPDFDSKNFIYMLFKLIFPSFGSIFKTAVMRKNVRKYTLATYKNCPGGPAYNII